MIVMLNKADLVPPEKKGELISLKEYFEDKGYKTFITSTAAHMGINELLDCVIETLKTVDYEPLFFTEGDIDEASMQTDNDSFDVTVTDGVYYVTGDLAERIMGTVNIDDYESLSYLQKLLKGKGILSALENAGVKDGDTVDIVGFEFEYYK